MSETTKAKAKPKPNGKDEDVVLIQCYIAGRKPLKAPDGETYAIGDFVPDAHLFPNLSLLLDRHRLLPCQMSPSAVKEAIAKRDERQRLREKAAEADRKRDYERQRREAMKAVKDVDAAAAEGQRRA